MHCPKTSPLVLLLLGLPWVSSAFVEPWQPRDPTRRPTGGEARKGGPAADEGRSLDGPPWAPCEAPQQLPLQLPAVAAKERDRRSLLLTGSHRLAAAAAACLPCAAGTSPPCVASSVPDTAAPNLRCLADLPAPAPGSVRLYLCRHGQTENNRLRRVQGARVDAPINTYGREMAVRMGLALSAVPDGLCPAVAVHSRLLRARETALLASSILTEAKRGGAGKGDPEAVLSALGGGAGELRVPPPGEAGGDRMRFATLDSLGEVDFGAGLDGKSVAESKRAMYATFAAWSLGRIDERMTSSREEGGGGESGESGREVLQRVGVALRAMGQMATENGGTLFAVSHSTFLRMLLATLLDISLGEAALLEQRNGCINVLDVNVEGMTETIGPRSNLFGGGRLFGANHFDLIIPRTKVVRQNECRHLEGITWPSN